MEEVSFRVFRGDGKGGREIEYRVPAVPGMVVLDAMHWIQAHLAGDLAVRWNCKAAKCGSCSAEINGFPRLMCKTRLDDYQGQTIYVHPLRTFPVIKDLVTDVSWNYEVNQKIAPFTPDPEERSPWIMYQEDVDRLYEPRKCIECFLCQDVCHVLRNHEEMQEYFGPRFMVRYQYLAMHPKDTLDRRGAVRHKGGIGLCNITKCCQEVCPEHIKITDNSIIPLKERVADEFFDPLRWLGHKLIGAKDRPKESEIAATVESPVVKGRRGRAPQLAPQPLTQWDGTFTTPVGIAVDADGNVYVADQRSSRVRKLSPSGQVIAQWGGPGSGPGEFNQPSSVAVDPRGNVYVADFGNSRVQKLSRSGRPLAQWGEPGQVGQPAGVAVDSQGNVYVADRRNSRVVKLSPDGRVLREYRGNGAGRAQFSSLGGLAVDVQGNIYVADQDNSRIQKLSPTGQVLAIWE